MQINNVSNKQLESCLKKLAQTKSVDVFYFADSFGNLKPSNIKSICKVIKKNWKKKLVFMHMIIVAELLKIHFKPIKMACLGLMALFRVWVVELEM